MAEILDNNMNEEEEIPVMVLTDLEDGTEREFEPIGECDYNGNHYYALVPLDEETEEYYIFRGTEDESGEITLETIEDDAEFEAVEDIFNDELFSEVDCDAE